MILNWGDMKHSAIPRFMRVLIFGMLFSSEVITWWCLNTAGKSFAAHAGGALCGLLMGVGFMTNFEIECWEVYLRWFCRLALAVFVTTGIVWFPAGVEISISALDEARLRADARGGRCSRRRTTGVALVPTL